MQEALLKVTDFWLAAGVDGLRLDAIPYLYERGRMARALLRDLTLAFGFALAVKLNA